MAPAARGGRTEGEAGFTLIELMMVVLVMAILLAIAIPTYFGLKRRASDRAVQSNVRHALSAMRIHYNGDQTYTGDPAVMNAAEPSLAWTDVPLTGGSPQRGVVLAVFPVPSADQTVVVGGRSSTGRCFFMKDTSGGGGGVYYDFTAPPAGDCTPPDPADPAWAGRWGS